MAGLAAYGASIIFTEGATAAVAPYVVGGLSSFCGGMFVFGQANKDIRRGEVSSGWDYVLGGAKEAVHGAAAGAAFCMAPYGAEVWASTAIPPGMTGITIGEMFVSGEAIMDIAMATSYSVTFSNMLVTANDSCANATGTNVMSNALGQEKYESVKYVSQAGSDTIFWSSLANPRFYGTNNNAGNIRQNAMYDNSEGGTSTSRPTWKQSEFDTATDFSNHYAQKSFINGEEVPYGTKQSVMIDVRGQNVSEAALNVVYDDIMQSTNNGVEILFKMD